MTDTADAGRPPARASERSPDRPGLLRSPTTKFFLIALLTLALSLPLLFVWGLTTERESRRDEVIGGVAAAWGRAQTVTGPLLTVPYTLRPTSANGPVERRTAVFLPEDLTVTVSAPVEARAVSIFTAPVYTATLRLAGRFGAADARVFGDGLAGVDWSRAAVAVGLSDVGGIEEATIALDDVALPLEAGVGPAAVDRTGVHGRLPPGLVDGPAPRAAAGFAFRIEVRLRGTDRLAVTPVGRQSEITLASTWPHPGFQGGTLPSERAVDATGFTATWRIPYLARAVPQAFVLEETGLDRLEADAVGAAFTQPVDHYALVERALKYGVMFVAALLGLVFVIEILSPRRIHVVQYSLVGLILVFFYVLLLALSEQVGFALAYAGAAGATVAVLSAFVGVALASLGRGLAALAGFSAVFAGLYVILDLEDLALLAGAVTGFCVLTVVLFATRGVDWSGAGRLPTAPPGRGSAG